MKGLAFVMGPILLAMFIVCVFVGAVAEFILALSLAGLLASWVWIACEFAERRGWM